MTNESDKSVLRWGGLASIGGGLLFLLVFAWVGLLAYTTSCLGQEELPE